MPTDHPVSRRRPALDPEFARVLRMGDPGMALDGPLTFLPPVGRVPRRRGGKSWRAWLEGPLGLNARALPRRRCRPRRNRARARTPVARPRPRRRSRCRRTRPFHGGGPPVCCAGWPTPGANAGSTSSRRGGGKPRPRISRWFSRGRARFFIFPDGCCCRVMRIGNGARRCQRCRRPGVRCRCSRQSWTGSIRQPPSCLPRHRPSRSMPLKTLLLRSRRAPGPPPPNRTVAQEEKTATATDAPWNVVVHNDPDHEDEIT